MTTARDVMTPDPDFVRAGASVREAAARMRALDVGSLPVCDDDGDFVGMITDRDITLRSTADGKDPTLTPVRDAMTRAFVYCAEDADVNAVAEVMRRHQIRRVPIVQRGQTHEVPPRELLGIVALGDLATDLPVTVADVAGRTLAEVSESSS